MTRIPEILERESLPEEHRPVFDYLVQTRGRVTGGMAVLLHSPDLTGRIAHTGTYLRFESVLPPRVREIAALAASSEMQNPYEQATHTLPALNCGASEASVLAIKSGAELDQIDADDRLVVRCARELLRDRDLSQATFDEVWRRTVSRVLSTCSQRSAITRCWRACIRPSMCHRR